jgi:hypothetical protein
MAPVVRWGVGGRTKPCHMPIVPKREINADRPWYAWLCPWGWEYWKQTFDGGDDIRIPCAK